MREWHSLWHFPQVKVVAGLSAWSRVFSRDLFSSACCVRFSSRRERERDPSSIPVSCFIVVVVVVFNYIIIITILIIIISSSSRIIITIITSSGITIIIITIAFISISILIVLFSSSSLFERCCVEGKICRKFALCFV